MRSPALVLSALLLAVLAGCVNTATGPTDLRSDNTEEIGAGESASADTGDRAGR